MPIFAVLGSWQGLVLSSDLVEFDYARRVPAERLAGSYLFLLGDQTRRPLWTFLAAARGAKTPLVYYASSYGLFTYGSTVPEDIRHPTLLLNIWDECWFQSAGARDYVAKLLSHNPKCRVVGGFDMVDSGDELPHLPPRSVAVFDVEPNAHPLRLSYAGYILPTLTEDVINRFWQKIADASRELDFVVLHKPKRFNSLRQEWRYRDLLRSLQAEGRYIPLAPTVGPMRLMSKVNASLVLPFTSVGDLAAESKTHAFYFDPDGRVADANKHAGGLPVVAGWDAMIGQLGVSLGRDGKRLKAAV